MENLTSSLQLLLPMIYHSNIPAGYSFQEAQLQVLANYQGDVPIGSLEEGARLWIFGCPLR